MNPPNDLRRELAELSARLGEPHREWVILGEGNTSARIDDETFWVKASGTRLPSVTESGFVQVRFDRVLELLDQDAVDDAAVERALNEARVDPDATLRPSVETLLHALCLQIEGVAFVAHTHPIAVNALTCSRDFETALAGRLFPDEIVVCGPAPVLVPYADPGVPLARAVRDGIDEYVRTHGERPKTVLMQNHGLVALGANAQQAEDITAMADKTARILVGTHALGGPRFMTEREVARIHTRPDEAYRQRMLHGKPR